jgi:hypothetical protein
MTTNKFNPLFRLIVKALKYFSFTVFGFIFAASLSNFIGTEYIADWFFPIIFGGIWRLGIILLCLGGTAVLIESFR